MSTSVRLRSLQPLDRLGALSYSVQNACTNGIRVAAVKEDRIEFLTLWAGQAVGLGRTVPAAEILKGTAREAARKLQPIGSKLP